MRRASRLAALALLLSSAGAGAVLCDGPCSITMSFANGGTLTPSNGATITFGAGGALTLGAGGLLTLGTGGSLDPDVDLGLGGTLVLGPGGSIQFGDGGLLSTGASGGIALEDASSLVVAGAASVVVDSSASVHLGDLSAGGTASLTADELDGNDTRSPIHLDTTGDITVTSDAAITYSSVAGASVVLTDTGTPLGNGFGDCSQGCPPAGGSALGSPTLPADSGYLTSTNPGGGAWGWGALLPLLLLGLLRRR